MTGSRLRRMAWIVGALAFSMASMGCQLLPSLLAGLGPALGGLPGQGPQGGPQGGPVADKLEEMLITGTALFPDAANPKSFVAIAGTKVEITDLPTGTLLGTGQADASGRFEIRIKVKTRPADTVVGIRAKATRASAYRVAAEITFEVLGLGGLAEASVDPASTVAAAKIFEEARAKGTSVKVDLQTFREMVSKVSEALTEEDITKISTGGGTGAAADLFEKLAGTDPALGALIESIFVPVTATPAPTPAPTRTPAGATPRPQESTEPEPTDEPSHEPLEEPSEEPSEEPTAEPSPDGFDFRALDLPDKIVLGVVTGEPGEPLIPTELDFFHAVPTEAQHLLHDVVWTSLDPDIAFFPQPGRLVAKAAGSTQIELKRGDLTQRIDVVVEDGGATAVEVK